MKYVVDRIENNIAILEEINTKNIIEVKVEKLPINIKEGTVLIQNNNDYQIDIQETKDRDNDISERFKKLFK